jgi:hypothetical protein
MSCIEGLHIALASGPSLSQNVVSAVSLNPSRHVTGQNFKPIVTAKKLALPRFREVYGWNPNPSSYPD